MVEAANKINFDVNDSQGRTAELQRQAGRWEIHDSSEHWSSPTRVALAQRIDHELLLYIRSSSRYPVIIGSFSAKLLTSAPQQQQLTRRLARRGMLAWEGGGLGSLASEHLVRQMKPCDRTGESRSRYVVAIRCRTSPSTASLSPRRYITLHSAVIRK